MQLPINAIKPVKSFAKTLSKNPAKDSFATATQRVVQQVFNSEIF